MSRLQVDRTLGRYVRKIRVLARIFPEQGMSPFLMEDLAHNEYLLDRFGLTDGECERKENKQVGLVAEATIAEAFQVSRGVSQTG